MPGRKTYTVTSATGTPIGKGDRVRIVYEGEVRSVDSRGYMVLKTDNGYTTYYDPGFQTPHKLSSKTP